MFVLPAWLCYRVTIHVMVLFVSLIVKACYGQNQEKEKAHHHQEVQKPEAPGSKKSIYQETHAQVGKVHLTIRYHAPAVRGRTIWGGLVPYDEVWVTGAHQATSVEISDNIRVGEIIVPKGRYAFFTIPGKQQWTLIINKNWHQHLADEYDEREDVLRLTVTPDTGVSFSERLVYRIEDTGGGSGKIIMHWENLMVALPFTTM